MLVSGRASQKKIKFPKFGSKQLPELSNQDTPKIHPGRFSRLEPFKYTPGKGKSSEPNHQNIKSSGFQLLIFKASSLKRDHHSCGFEKKTSHPNISNKPPEPRKKKTALLSTESWLFKRGILISWFIIFYPHITG